MNIPRGSLERKGRDAGWPLSGVQGGRLRAGPQDQERVVSPLREQLQEQARKRQQPHDEPGSLHHRDAPRGAEPVEDGAPLLAGGAGPNWGDGRCAPWCRDPAMASRCWSARRREDRTAHSQPSALGTACVLKRPMGDIRALRGLKSTR